jgi:glutathione S-transferase
MKLFYHPGACSLSPHIVLLEAGLPFTAENVAFDTKKTDGGVDFLTINSKGAVPALQMDDGFVLTEGAAIVQYIADQKPQSGLAPVAGSRERYQLMELLNYISAEVHKNFSPLFNPHGSAESKASLKETLAQKFKWLTQYLGKKSYLMGNTFTVADAYLFTVLGWAPHVGVDLSGYRN